jgi:pimeloyl-ACP methyl ester carboxylesterase
MAALERHTLAINGAEIIYRRGGPKEQLAPTLVFLHGAGGSANAFGLLEKLADDHHVIIADHPGFGESDTPEWLETIHDMAFFYLDVFEALDLKNVHLAGQSLGGWIAMEIAVRSTARISRLILCGAAGINLPDVPMGDLFSWDKETRYRTMIFHKELAEKLLAIPSSPEQDAIAAKNEATTRKLSWEPRFHDPDLHKWLHRITVATHIIWGSHDPVFPLPYGEKLKDLIPGAAISVIEECGHLPQVDAPGALKALISAELTAA